MRSAFCMTVIIIVALPLMEALPFDSGSQIAEGKAIKAKF